MPLLAAEMVISEDIIIMAISPACVCQLPFVNCLHAVRSTPTESSMVSSTSSHSGTIVYVPASCSGPKPSAKVFIWAITSDVLDQK